MAKKPSITTVASGYQSTTTINDNTQNLRDAFDNTLSLDGSTPNAMLADFDMNSNDIINVDKLYLSGLYIDGQPVAPGTLNYNGVIKETQTATSGQTVFNLTTMVYNPGINNLSVYVDGVYQNPSTYTENNSTRITFSAGLHVGAIVDFVALSINEITGAADASSVTYTPLSQSFYGSSTITVKSALDQTSNKLKQYISVKDYGAVGDGVTDDTTKIQACFTYCTSIGATAYFPAGVYSVDELTVSNGIGGIYCDGTIKGRGTASVAVIVLGSAGNPVTNANFVLRMDQSSGDLRAVQGYDTSNCSFTNCIIYGFVNSATLNHYAFWMEGPCKNNTWANNRISLYPLPTQRGFGIAFYGTVGTGLPYGGFFNGVVSRAQFPAVNNTIVGNVILDGSYAVSLQAADYNTVSGNTFYNQNHRSIYLANASWGNTLNGNVLREFNSSAVVLGYGSSNNVVSGNFCETSVPSGEAAININSGSRSNLISGNKILAASNYGVYIATDSIDTSVIGNDIGEHYLAAIAVENDFESPRPTNAIFSRPNYGAPPSPYTAWSFIDMTGVVIKNNTIRAGYTGRSTAAIYIAQITSAGNTRTSNIIIDGNSVVSPTNIAYNLFLYEETATYLTDIRALNNDFNSGNTEISANTLTTSATWNDKISYFANNKQLDLDLIAEEINFTDGDTSPSVLQNSGVANSRLFQFVNTAPTSVTTFDDSFENQDITVRLNANTTIVYNAAIMRTKGSVDIVGSSTNQIVAFKRIGTVWVETWRNF